MRAGTTLGAATLTVVLCLAAGGARAALPSEAGARARVVGPASTAERVQPPAASAKSPTAAAAESPTTEGAEPRPAAERAPQERAEGRSGAAEHRGEAGEGEAEHAESIWSTIARLINFAVLAGAIYYFARSPFVQYLVQRSREIRAELTRAAASREQALAEMARIEARIKELPSEIDALRRRGAEDIAAEETRIRQAAQEERVRLQAHARQEIDRSLRLAERELVQLTADLAIKAASARIRATIDGEDQLRLVDQYLTGMAGKQPTA